MSELKVNKISPATGTAFTLGDSGDTFTIPSGATIVNSGTATNFGSAAKWGQTVVVTKTDISTFTSASYVDVTGMSVTITPTSATSKILCIGDAVLSNFSNYAFFKIIRGIGGTFTEPAGFVGDAAGSRIQCRSSNLYAEPDNNTTDNDAWHIIDTPNTTSAVTYKMQVRNNGTNTNTIYVNRATNDPDSSASHRTVSMIMAVELLA